VPVDHSAEPDLIGTGADGVGSPQRGALLVQDEVIVAPHDQRVLVAARDERLVGGQLTA
jgi:hypothetical protein